MLMLVSALAIILLLFLTFVILLVLVGGLAIVFTVVLALVLIPKFINIGVRVRLSLSVFLNTVPLVCGIYASIKIGINRNMDNNTTTSAKYVLIYIYSY